MQRNNWLSLLKHLCWTKLHAKILLKLQAIIVATRCEKSINVITFWLFYRFLRVIIFFYSVQTYECVEARVFLDHLTSSIISFSKHCFGYWRSNINWRTIYRRENWVLFVRDTNWLASSFSVINSPERWLVSAVALLWLYREREVNGIDITSFFY